MPLPLLFLVGYTLTLSTYEAAKSKKPSTQNLLRDVIRYEKTTKK